MTAQNPPSLGDMELKLIRSARTELPGYRLIRRMHPVLPQTDYTLFSPAGEEAASLTAHAGAKPWIVIAAPRIASGTLQECLFINQEGEKASLMRFSGEDGKLTDFVRISDKSTLRQMWEEFPTHVKQMAHAHGHPDTMQIYAGLCCVASTYPRIVDLANTPEPSIDNARFERMVRRFEREGIPAPPQVN